jgi:hypothetical protein
MEEKKEDRAKLKWYPTPKDHEFEKFPKEFGIAQVFLEGNQEFRIFSHPVDKRGYRVVVSYASDNGDIVSTWNRPWTKREFKSLFQVASVLQQFYFNVGLFPQVEFLGNNAMKQVEDYVLVGQVEPAQLHLHIVFFLLFYRF